MAPPSQRFAGSDTLILPGALKKVDTEDALTMLKVLNVITTTARKR